MSHRRVVTDLTYVLTAVEAWDALVVASTYVRSADVFAWRDFLVNLRYR